MMSAIESPSSSARPSKRRRVPDELRKRSMHSCDLCRKRRCKCVPSETLDGKSCSTCQASGVRCSYNLPRKTRIYGSLDDLSGRYRCLEALVKGAFPDEVTDTVPDLVDLGTRLGFEMPDLGAEETISVGDLMGDKPYITNSSTAAQNLGSLKDIPSIRIERQEENWLGNPSRNIPPGLQDPHTAQRRQSSGFLHDASGQAHFIGPSGTLSFFADLRNLVRSREKSQGLPGMLASSQFARDETTRALEADELQESTDPEPTHILAGSSPQSIQSELFKEFSGPARPDPVEYLKRLPSQEVIERLLHAYFTQVHRDFPLFHRAMFEDELESFVFQPRARLSGSSLHSREPPIAHISGPDFGWLGCLYMILLLGSVSATTGPSEPSLSELRRGWLAEVRLLLPQMIMKCTITNVQALLLQSLFLHNNNHRNGAWTLLGTATRIAFALGMHRQDVDTAFRPTDKEVRKRVFCTLYGFEQFLASSLGRPSGLDDFDVDVKAPRNGFLDDVTGLSSQLTYVSSSLQKILGQTRSAIARLKESLGRENTLNRDSTSGPDQEILEILRAWKRDLPMHIDIPDISHLNDTTLAARSETTTSRSISMRDFKMSLSRQTPTQVRSLVLLHIQYHYVALLVTRPTLLRQVSSLYSCSTSRKGSQEPGQNHGDESSQPRRLQYSSMSTICEFHAGQLVALIIFLAELNLINGVTALDLFYAYSAGLVLTLSQLRESSRSRSSRRVSDVNGNSRAGSDGHENTRILIQMLRSAVEPIEKCATMRRMIGVMNMFADSIIRDGDAQGDAQQPVTNSQFLAGESSSAEQSHRGRSQSQIVGNTDVSQVAFASYGSNHIAGHQMLDDGPQPTNHLVYPSSYWSSPDDTSTEHRRRAFDSHDNAHGQAVSTTSRHGELQANLTPQSQDHVGRDSQTVETTSHHISQRAHHQHHPQQQPHVLTGMVPHEYGTNTLSFYDMHQNGMAMNPLNSGMVQERAYYPQVQHANNLPMSSIWFDPLGSLSDGQILDWADLENILASCTDSVSGNQ